MPVPDFQSMMLPILVLLGDKQEHLLNDVYDALANEFGVSEDERNQLLPSGRQSRFNNRVGWAQTHLVKAGLLERTGRARFCITQRGLDVLANPPEIINIHYLQQFPEFVEFRNSSRSSSSAEKLDEDETAFEQHQTPQELLESSYQLLRRTLAQELLERIKSCTPRFFELLVVDLLVAMGYGGSRKDAGQAVGQSGDGGIDGIIKEDKLGLDAVYIQAKRWEGTVGRPVVQAFAGSLEGHRARKGVLLTTSGFSNDALAYVERIEKKIVLIDGEQLAQLLIDHNVGIAEVATYIIKKIDADYFDESL